MYLQTNIWPKIHGFVHIHLIISAGGQFFALMPILLSLGVGEQFCFFAHTHVLKKAVFYLCTCTYSTVDSFVHLHMQTYVYKVDIFIRSHQHVHICVGGRFCTFHLLISAGGQFSRWHLLISAGAQFCTFAPTHIRRQTVFYR